MANINANPGSRQYLERYELSLRRIISRYVEGKPPRGAEDKTTSWYWLGQVRRSHSWWFYAPLPSAPTHCTDATYAGHGCCFTLRFFRRKRCDQSLDASLFRRKSLHSVLPGQRGIYGQRIAIVASLSPFLCGRPSKTLRLPICEIPAFYEADCVARSIGSCCLCLALEPVAVCIEYVSRVRAV
jgi:hypothetical protein